MSVSKNSSKISIPTLFNSKTSIKQIHLIKLIKLKKIINFLYFTNKCHSREKKKILKN